MLLFTHQFDLGSKVSHCVALHTRPTMWSDDCPCLFSCLQFPIQCFLNMSNKQMLDVPHCMRPQAVGARWTIAVYYTVLCTIYYTVPYTIYYILYCTMYYILYYTVLYTIQAVGARWTVEGPVDHCVTLLPSLTIHPQEKKNWDLTASEF